MKEKEAQENKSKIRYCNTLSLDCCDDLRVLLLEYKNKEDIPKKQYKVPDVKKIIQLCSNKKYLSIMVKN